MLIQCLIERDGDTVVEWEFRYTFSHNKLGHSVCDVAHETHAKRFLALGGLYRVYPLKTLEDVAEAVRFVEAKEGTFEDFVALKNPEGLDPEDDPDIFDEHVPIEEIEGKKDTETDDDTPETDDEAQAVEHSLTDLQKELLRLADQEELTHQAIADKMNMTKGKVQSQIQSARRKVKKALEKEGPVDFEKGAQEAETE